MKSAIIVQWLSNVHEMRYFYNFSEVFEKSLDGNGQLNS